MKLSASPHEFPARRRARSRFGRSWRFQTCRRHSPWFSTREISEIGPHFFGDIPMRVMVMVKATKDSEAGVKPSQQLLTEMGKYNEELVKAGIMLAGDGLHPSSKGARVRFSGSD